MKPTGGKPLILAADAMYTLENMKDAIPPGLAWDIPQSLQALYIFKMMDHLNAAVIPSHDPDFWRSKAPAPKIFAP